MTTQGSTEPTKDTKPKTTAADRPEGAPADDYVTLQKLGFGALPAFGTNWAEVMSDLGSEVVSFVAERIREDVKTQHEILHCKSMGEMQQIQARFMQKAIEQYTAETGKLVEMSQALFATGKPETKT